MNSDIVSELEPLFRPRSVAVIGATNNLNKWGFSTFTSLKNRFEGDLYPVNNRDDEVLGYKAFKKITDIPGHVDLAVLVIPAEHVAGVMEDCVEKGVKAGIIISAGFAETGPEGRKMQDEVVARAAKGGIRFVGPNCMGMWSAAANLPAFMFPLPVIEGPLGLVSQGGNIGGSLVIDGYNRGIGFRQYISCGCTADIKLEDYIEYMGEDDSVEVIMVYIEGLPGDGLRFMEKVRKVTTKKPVVALKPGKTLAAARAISSHSGTLSGSDAIYDAVFKKAGILRVDTSMEMLDVAIGLITQPLPKGRNVVITTPGGSYGVMCAEACATRGLNVVDLPAEALEVLNTMFPPRWSHGNPVDPAGDRNFLMYLKAPELLLKYPEIDALIFMGFGSFSGISAMLASANEEVSKDFKKAREKIAGLKDIARSVTDILDSGDQDQIKNITKMGLGIIFGQVTSSNPGEVDDFINTITEALTTEKMRKSTFFTGMRELFEAIATGDMDGVKLAGIMELIEPMLSGLIDHWINRFGKPVITTTFTEETSKLGEGGHFPYPSAERAAAVLSKLVEYSEYLDYVNG